MGRIVWIASYPKSGNTWTRAFLHNLFEGRDRPLSLKEVSQRSPLDSERRYFAQVLGDRPELLAAEEAAAARADVQRLLASAAPDNALIKTHCAMMRWHGHAVFDMSLTAGAIYVVRNPLDIAASYADHSGTAVDRIVDVMTAPNYVLPGSRFQAPQLLGDWSQHVESWTGKPAPGLHVMRYEDMLESPHTAFGGLVRFLGLPAPAERIARAVAFSSFDTLRALEDEGSFGERRPHQERFFRKGRAGGWKEELDESQVTRIVEAHRQQMARFGYLPT